MKIAGEKGHRLVCSDTATGKLVWLDEQGQITREVDGVGGVFDFWVLPEGDVLYASNNGPGNAWVARIAPDNTERWRFPLGPGRELFSCQPLADGRMVLGVLGTPQIWEVDGDGSLLKQIDVPYAADANPHEGMRIVRRLGQVYYLIQPGANRLLKLNEQGELLADFPIHADAFGLTVEENGHIVYTCMSGAYELDEAGNEVWTLTDADIPEMGIRWLLGLQRLSDGELAFANWMGHGHDDEGVPLFAVNRQKEVVWVCDSRGMLGMPSTLQILDVPADRVCFTPTR